MDPKRYKSFDHINQLVHDGRLSVLDGFELANVISNDLFDCISRTMGPLPERKDTPIDDSTTLS